MVVPVAVQIAGLLLAAFGALAFVDGVYLHLWRYRLQERSSSRFEHLAHTLGSLLFIPTLILLYGVNSAGWLLWLGTGLLVADFLAAGVDAFSERESRSWQGGLREGEYLLHLVLVTLRAASTTLVLASKPAEAWSLSAPSVLAGNPSLTTWIAWNMLPGALLVAGLHLALVFRPMLISEVETWWRDLAPCCPKLCKVFA